MDQARFAEDCGSFLSEQDVRHICRARGFSAREASTRKLFSLALLSDVGLARALSGLDLADRILLHRLAGEEEPVPLPFFAGAYSTMNDVYLTFTQRNRPVYKALQEHLIRRGVVLVREMSSFATTQLEKLEFAIVPCAVALLAPPCDAVPLRCERSEIRPDPLRCVIKSIAEGRGDLVVRGTKLYFHDKPFTARGAQAWRDGLWQKSLKSVTGAGSCVPVVRRAFARLDRDLWVAPSRLAPLVSQHYFSALDCQSHVTAPTAPTAEEVCEAGFESGFLARTATDQGLFYRHGQFGEESDESLEATGDRVTVDLDKISPADLESLASVSSLTVDRGRLVAVPDLVGIGRRLTSSDRVIAWLFEEVPAWKRARKQMQDRVGRHVVHENLVVARIRDLTVRTQLQKTVPTVVALDGEFVAFPRGVRSDVERFARKSGLAPREVRS